MKIIFVLLTVLLMTSNGVNAEWRGNFTLNNQYYFNDGLLPEQHNNYLSASFEPEYFQELGDSNTSVGFTFKPFLRVDEHDEERNHFDFREYNLLVSHNDWEVRLGLGKVFWGVTESQHLVDIINQSDFVENIDGEDKLGQPLVSLTLNLDSSTVDLFFLPGFRERSFPGQEGRPRTPLVVDTDSSEYESSAENKHFDYALRWSGTVMNDWDLGMHYFSGTSRDPQLIQKVINGEQALVPRYNLIEQVGIDLQATLEEWLLKLEAIQRSGEPKDYSAAVTGFEYTFIGIQDSNINLGMLMEYHYDSRDTEATTPFQNDLFIGSRFDFSDAQSTEVLAGGVFDLDTSTRSFRVEAARRIGQNWKLTGELQVFEHIDKNNLQFSQRDDDFLSLELARYF